MERIENVIKHEDYNLIQEYERYKQELYNYVPYFKQHYSMRKQQGQGQQG